MTSGGETTDPVHESAVRLLARRDHSRLELANKLTQRGFDEAEVEAEIERLITSGLLDDGRFAELFVEQRMRRGDGPVKIRAALGERGVTSGLIDSALEPLAEEWPECARAVLHKRFGDSHAGDRREQARRVRFLQGRGFPAGLAMRAVEQSGNPDAEDQA